MTKKVIVIGAGPAGMMAAGQVAKRGLEVTLIERNPRPGRKLMITGKGRCNITNATFDLQELISQVPTNPRFLYSAFSGFMPYDTIEFFESIGVKTKIERGGRVFPETDKAVTVVDAMVGFVRKSGARMVNSRVAEIIHSNNSVTGVRLESGETLQCDGLIIATGGKSYQQTGSTGDGYSFAKKLGHTVTYIRPSLVPLNVDEKWCSELQGLSLKNTAIKVVDKGNGKETFSDFGEMLFTHFGVSGPMILSASAHMKNMDKTKYKILIDLKPALSEEQLEKRIVREFLENVNRDFGNSISSLFPSKLVPVMIKLSGIPGSMKCNQITKEMRHKFAFLIKNLEINITSFRDINEAIVTSGGVKVSEIEPKTMKSKIVNNLYFAGEIIDVDAYTGGFNLQIAFSTGYLAGIKVLEEII